MLDHALHGKIHQQIKDIQVRQQRKMLVKWLENLAKL